MVHILVNLKEVKYNDICTFYNNHKNKEWNSISKLDRFEGGFCIPIGSEDDFDSTNNQQSKQVRWNRKRLVTPGGCCQFTLEELTLLHKAMAHVHGDDNVFLETGPIYK
jgi:hypothetical protein